jgi:hypothetical protein
MFKKSYKPTFSKYGSLVIAKWSFHDQVLCTEFITTEGTVTGGWKYEAS